ncbi:50S ribosomal protein L23 [Candidatus Falkowbacteria bacterium CG10_big_fil_rev_8_21_14_0_10_43_11]|uniref:Large ribosomal subunit protein uL23 n=1 Tax=Candidatus Falkowbacteria bacterium CG10_big_fil_rev_8_21_14_0_10_43_11 TaxID=1974568 RepID=A0A2M6WLV4_9BACT|nr:MAG: 50S ribosomal protein L23 [Candidatus Falkowbacteria bacterium CG10_big_fil_rev_8_21_14_0_10_43_11]
MKDLYDGGISATATDAKKGKSAARGSYLESYRVLIKPLVTEKAAKIGAANKYAFVVSKEANKIMVAKAIEHVYGVKPVRINIINRTGKVVRSRRGNGKRKDWKKAIISLPKGKNINIYEGV